MSSTQDSIKGESKIANVNQEDEAVEVDEKKTDEKLVGKRRGRGKAKTQGKEKEVEGKKKTIVKGIEEKKKTNEKVRKRKRKQSVSRTSSKTSKKSDPKQRSDFKQGESNKSSKPIEEKTFDELLSDFCDVEGLVLMGTDSPAEWSQGVLKMLTDNGCISV